MKRFQKLTFGATLSFALLLPGCGGATPLSSDAEKESGSEMEEAIQLNARAHLDDKLRITIDCETPFFKSGIAKESVFLVPEEESGSSAIEKIDFEGLYNR